jgi:acetylornithine deacetylase/succinyl-diaminopimelate desuccinylase-like protein
MSISLCIQKIDAASILHYHSHKEIHGDNMTGNTIHQRPAELLQNLIRFNTTNPPGNERPCIEYINGLLKETGIETTLVAKTPERPNLIARLKGEGNAPPLMLYGHVDVVTTENQKWTHPPFEGNIVDGYIWGRGTLDMKSGIAMYLAAILKAKAEGTHLPGDIIFTAVADEEVTSEVGAQFLVEEHADLFKGIRYALSEFGGASLSLGGKRFYPIQTAEKYGCPARVIFHGTGGHGAVPVHGAAMAKLAAALRTLDRHPLPVHITPPTRLMFETIAKGLGGIQGWVLGQMLNPLFTELILKAVGSEGATYSALLHNTVSPTIIEASDKRNVIPSEIVLDLDGRLLPGFTADDLKRELQTLLGDDCIIETIMPVPGPAEADMNLYELLAGVLKGFDPQGVPFPFVNYGVTDARFFSRLGIQTYGFMPMEIPEGLGLTSTIHAADERIPVAAMDFGTRAVFEVLQKFS